MSTGAKHAILWRLEWVKGYFVGFWLQLPESVKCAHVYTWLFWSHQDIEKAKEKSCRFRFFFFLVVIFKVWFLPTSTWSSSNRFLTPVSIQTEEIWGAVSWDGELELYWRKNSMWLGSGHSSVVRAPISWSYSRWLKVLAGVAGEFSSLVSTFCADSYFGVHSTPVLPQ